MTAAGARTAVCAALPAHLQAGKHWGQGGTRNPFGIILFFALPFDCNSPDQGMTAGTGGHWSVGPPALIFLLRISVMVFSWGDIEGWVAVEEAERF